MRDPGLNMQDIEDRHAYWLSREDRRGARCNSSRAAMDRGYLLEEIATLRRHLTDAQRRLDIRSKERRHG